MTVTAGMDANNGVVRPPTPEPVSDPATGQTVASTSLDGARPTLGSATTETGAPTAWF